MKELWTLGFIVNIFLLASVFDIYFKSPIVEVPVAHRGSYRSGISRVIFFVADGLRADTFFENPHLRPRLTDLMSRKEGVSYGISDTRVPTESRPGHIALFAGFYEDPSAVFTGWKNNLVEFDSVFNRTEKAIALGSPDIIHMFARGAAKHKIYAETYSSDWQDFLAANSSVLDTWVFDKFEDLSKSKRLPYDENSIVFLHLLGIDNTGHATKPHSVEYKAGLLLVDKIVEKVENIVREYYQDGKTLFIFTSDHGMTDWGSHGSGSLHETETPYVVWGPGIQSNRNLRIKQADFTPLISGSLGSEFPTNSVGKFPFTLWKAEKFPYFTLRANLLQVYELLLTKKRKTSSERNFPLIQFYKENEILTGLKEAEELESRKEYEKAIEVLSHVFDTALEGNSYYERYDQQLLIVFSVLVFLSFVCLLALIVTSMGKVDKSVRSSDIFSLQSIIFSIMASSLVIKGLVGWSLWRIGYGFLPIYLSLVVGKEVDLRRDIIRESVRGGFIKLTLGLGFSLVGIQMLVMSFSQRNILSLALILNLIWTLIVHKGKGSSRHLLVLATAVGSLALFPSIPIIGNSHSPFFTTLGTVLSSGIGVLVLKNVYGFMNGWDKGILGLQLILVTAVAILVHFPTFLLTRIISWISLGLAFLSPTLTTSENLTLRLVSIFLGIAAPFSFLGVSYETLFLPSLFTVLILLFKLEVDEDMGIPEGTDWTEFFKLCTLSRMERLSTRDAFSLNRAFRRAWFHLFFVFLSFFGTGNIGSISSFDPSCTRCFVSVFNPWLMMVLMLTKILGPFLLVSSFWRALLPSKVHVERNFGIVLLFCQGMGFHMFFKVTNIGSWLEIGTSISHFVIVQSITLFLFVLHFVANYLVCFEFLRNSRRFPETVAQIKFGKDHDI